MLRSRESRWWSSGTAASPPPVAALKVVMMPVGPCLMSRRVRRLGGLLGAGVGLVLLTACSAPSVQTSCALSAEGPVVVSGTVPARQPHPHLRVCLAHGECATPLVNRDGHWAVSFSVDGRSARSQAGRSVTVSVGQGDSRGAVTTRLTYMPAHGPCGVPLATATVHLQPGPRP